MKGLLYGLGRFLQLVGLIMLPFAIAGNLGAGEPLDLRQSLTVSGLGVAVFVVGWALQRAGAPR
jgi:hypothetical protein